MNRHALATLSVATVAAAGALSGCGSSSDAKPAYCADKSNLESSVKGLASVDVTSNGVNALTTQLQKVQDDAKSLVSSAKSDFPDQTSAINTSVNSLTAAVQGLPSSPSVQQVAAVATDGASVASAVKGFSDAAGSKC